MKQRDGSALSAAKQNENFASNGLFGPFTRVRKLSCMGFYVIILAGIILAFSKLMTCLLSKNSMEL